MPRPWRVMYEGARYHITSRGNARQKIFLIQQDYERFVDQLAAAVEKDEVILYAYVLMQNHYHLLIETPLANVDRFMQRLNTAYPMYFRYKHRRPGHCLQGRYGAKVVGGEEYIVRLSRYMHMNPIETKRWKGRPATEKLHYLGEYRWSSYGGYVHKKGEQQIVDYRWLELMGRRSRQRNRAAYRRYIAEMAGDEQDAQLHEALAASRYAIGDEDFVERIEQDVRKKVAAHEGDVFGPRERLAEIRVVETAVAKQWGVRAEDLHSNGHRTGVAKTVAVELACRLTGESQRQVGRFFGYTSDSSVVKQRGRFRSLISQDKDLRAKTARLQKRLLHHKSRFKV